MNIFIHTQTTNIYIYIYVYIYIYIFAVCAYTQTGQAAKYYLNSFSPEVLYSAQIEFLYQCINWGDSISCNIRTLDPENFFQVFFIIMSMLPIKTGEMTNETKLMLVQLLVRKNRTFYFV